MYKVWCYDFKAFPTVISHLVELMFKALGLHTTLSRAAEAPRAPKKTLHRPRTLVE